MTHRREHALDRVRHAQMVRSAGKSKKASSPSRSLVRQATALSCLALYLSANTSIAASAAARGGAHKGPSYGGDWVSPASIRRPQSIVVTQIPA